MTNHEIANQIERDFKVPHPKKRLLSGLNRASDAEVTPFVKRVARTRLAEMARKGYTDSMDAAILLLMRGARREAVAAGLGYPTRQTGDFVLDVRHRLRGLNEADVDAMMGVALSNLDLMRRA